MTNPEDLNVRVDFDLTLFNSKHFAADLWQNIAWHSGVTVEQVAADGATFHVDPVLGGYEFDKHTASYGLDPNVMWSELDDIVRSTDYLFDDSIPFMTELRGNRYNPRILSFGEDCFQRAKIIPYLGRLAGNEDGQIKVNEIGLDVVFRRKAEHIAEKHPNERGVLVDDVPNQGLHEGFVEVHIDRSLILPGPLEKPEGFTVANLEQAYEVISSL